MPELPEVETVRRGLAPAMEKRRILSAHANRSDLRFPFPDRFEERLTGNVVERLDRRAKYLLIRLGSGDTLLVHLGMSGRFSVEAEDISQQPGDFVYAAPANPKHDHVVLKMEGGVTVTYNDTRRFGFMVLFRNQYPGRGLVLEGFGAGAGQQRVFSAQAWLKRSKEKGARSKPACWTNPSWRDLAISMSAKRYGAPRFHPNAWRAILARRGWIDWPVKSAMSSLTLLRRVDRP